VVALRHGATYAVASMTSGDVLHALGSEATRARATCRA